MESLIVQVYKGKYHPHITFIQASRIANTSRDQQSHTKGRELLSSGYRVNIGSGESTLVWRDRWVPGLPNFTISTPPPMGTINMRVKQLMDETGMRWDLEKLLALFSPAKIASIQAIPIYSMGLRDSSIWHFIKLGVYNVKS